MHQPNDVPPRVTIAELHSFEDDLRRLQAMMAAVIARRQRGYGGSADDDPASRGEIEQLRRTLVRRAGRVRAVVDRLNGGALNVHAAPAAGGRTIGTVWDAALTGIAFMSQTESLERLADRVGMAAGRLEADPSLADPPRPIEPTVSPSQTIVVHGGSVNIGQTARGDVHQTVTPAAELAEVARLLGELRQAIAELDAGDDEKRAFLEPVERLGAEVGKPNPLRAALAMGWTTMTGIATVEGTWQGWDRVQRLAGEVAQHLAPVIQSGPPPGMA